MNSQNILDDATAKELLWKGAKPSFRHLEQALVSPIDFNYIEMLLIRGIRPTLELVDQFLSIRDMIDDYLPLNHLFLRFGFDPNAYIRFHREDTPLLEILVRLIIGCERNIVRQSRTMSGSLFDMESKRKEIDKYLDEIKILLQYSADPTLERGRVSVYELIKREKSLQGTSVKALLDEYRQLTEGFLTYDDLVIAANNGYFPIIEKNLETNLQKNLSKRYSLDDLTSLCHAMAIHLFKCDTSIERTFSIIRLLIDNGANIIMKKPVQIAGYTELSTLEILFLVKRETLEEQEKRITGGIYPGIREYDIDSIINYRQTLVLRQLSKESTSLLSVIPNDIRNMVRDYLIV